MLEEGPTNPGSRAWESCRIVSRSITGARRRHRSWDGAPVRRGRRQGRGRGAQRDQRTGGRRRAGDRLRRRGDLRADRRRREGRQPRDDRRRGRPLRDRRHPGQQRVGRGRPRAGRVQDRRDHGPRDAGRVPRADVGDADRVPDHEGQGLRARHQHLLAQRRERAHGYRRLQHRERGAAHADAFGGARVGADRCRGQRDLPGRARRPRPGPCSPSTPSSRRRRQGVDPHGAPRRSRGRTSRRSRCSWPAKTAAG